MLVMQCRGSGMSYGEALTKDKVKLMKKNYELHVSINTGWINKYDTKNPPIYTTKYGKKDPYNCSRGWGNTDFYIEDFIEAVCIEGHAFLPQIVNRQGKATTPDDYIDEDDLYFNGPYKERKNFHRTNVVATDIDKDYDSVEQILEHPFFKQYGTLLYTSASHNPDEGKIKCRVVFRTEHDIEDGTDLTFLYTALIKTCGGDTSCKDPCRMFFGSQGSDYHSFPEKFMPWNVVEELIKNGKEIVRKKLGYDKQSTAEQKVSQANPFDGNRQTIKQDTNITLTDGDVIKFREIPSLFKQCGAKKNDSYKFKCHCPLHDDTNPSAFISANKSNIPYLYCSKCSPSINGGKAFFMAYSSNRDLEESKIEVIERNERYLSELPDFEGALLVKSPKGTGKTEQLIPIVEKWGIFLDVEKRDPQKPLPNLMLKALKFSRVKN